MADLSAGQGFEVCEAPASYRVMLDSLRVSPGYKQTEVGVIPEDWGWADFGCFYSEPSRNGIYKSVEFQGSGTRIVNMGEMFGLEFISNQEMKRVALTAKELSVNVLQNGDLLFGRRSIVPAGAGKCSIVVELHEPLTFESSIIRVRLNPLEVHPAYYYYFFSSPAGRATMSTIVSGTNVKGIRSTELKILKVPQPPLLEQRAIATALSDVDALLASLDKLIAKKCDLKQGAMQQLLTGQRRLPGFGGDWEQKRLGDLFTFSGGLSASRDQLSDSGYCYLHYGDIHKSSKAFIDVAAEFMDIPKLDVRLSDVGPSALLKDGDVVFVDASEDDEGTSRHWVVVNREDRPYISGLHTIVAKSRDNSLSNGFKRYCFQTQNIKQQFRFFAVGTKVSGISKTNIAKLELKFPPLLEEQTAIAAALSDMDAEIAALEARRDKTRAIKQGMMQELLTGRIRLV